MKLYVRFICMIGLISVCAFLLTACKDKTSDKPGSEPAETEILTPVITAPVVKETYEISYKANGGNHYPEKAVKTQGEAFLIPAETPERKCYSFDGWYVAEEPEKLYRPGDSYTEDRTTEFLPSWILADSVDDPELGANRISLSGKREDFFMTDKYYYYEGDSFFVYFDKDLKIPGDFCDNIALVMEQLEKETGLSFIPEGKIKAMSEERDSFFGAKDPWRYIDGGKKVLIYVVADREATGYISSSSSNGKYVTLVLFDLFTDELWNSVPNYRDNPWRLSGFISYYEIAHELTHTLTTRYHAGTTYVMSEGSADYYAERVMRALQNRSEDFRKSYENFEKVQKSTKIAKKITPKTAETIFVTDFEDVSFAERGDEYIFGRMLFEFITERYGDTFLKDYLMGASDRMLRSVFSSPPAHEADKHAQLIKDLAGEDVFTEFGKWYQSGKYSK
ncbi:MAG: InlB B-repeat-containing protein [Lachnospiraceae bacterium]|nr:InlB B-repeat-containing protein [Lachnospiraceae bacterium]